MSYHLSRRAVLKWLEIPCVYNLATDELYELDKQSFRFLKHCITREGCRSRDGAFIDYCLEEGIITPEPLTVKHPLLVPAPAPSLRYLELQITNRCNLNCLHCSAVRGPDAELSPGEVKNAIRSFEEMQGLSVIITGGEPLLHRRFEEINEMLPDFFVRKILFTNGLLLDKEKVKSLRVDEIRLSIDGMELAHDAVRGKGTFKRSVQAMKTALDAGFAVSISTMIHKRNLTDFDAMENLFKKSGIKDWVVDAPCLSHEMSEIPDFMASPAEGGKFLGYGFGSDFHSAGMGLSCGTHLMTITPEGNIVKCMFYRDSVAGSIDSGLSEAWRKLNPVPTRHASCNCEYHEACKGGCRYRAEQTGGGKDLYRCRLYGVLKNPFIVI